MDLILDLILTAASIFVIGTHAVVGKNHFKSQQMPMGANLVTAAVLTAFAVFMLLVWTGISPWPAVLAGIALEGLALWMFHRTAAASREGGLHFAFDKDHPVSLVTRGPYRFVRHPFYTSYLIFWTGLAIATWTVWALPVVVAMAAIYTIAARDEERKFASSPMAAEYAHYRSRTGMFWPGRGA